MTIKIIFNFIHDLFIHSKMWLIMLLIVIKNNLWYYLFYYDFFLFNALLVFQIIFIDFFYLRTYIIFMLHRIHIICPCRFIRKSSSQFFQQKRKAKMLPSFFVYWIGRRPLLFFGNLFKVYTLICIFYVPLKIGICLHIDPCSDKVESQS